MEHGKKAYGEDSFQKTGDGGFCRPLHISRMKKDGRIRKAELPSFLCLYMYFISQPSRRARFKILPVAFLGIKRLGIL